ncbi:MAG: hypothetical protein AB7S44_02185 [Spirochaetales bacterium]
MKIKKVETSKFYKEKYIYSEGSIYQLKPFYEQNPKLKNRTDRVLKSSSKNVVTVTYNAFPSNRKMLENLIEKRQDIYEKINLSAIKCRNADIVKIIVLYDYLARRIRYDMTSIEDVVTEDKSLDKLNEKIEGLYDEAVKIYLKNRKQTSKQQALNTNAQLTQKLKEHFIENLKYNNRVTYLENRSYLKNLYNVSFYDKGICGEFSYDYQFMVQGLNVDSFVVSIAEKGAEHSHAFVIIPYEIDGAIYSCVADLTMDTPSNPKKVLRTEGFGLTRRQYNRINPISEEIVEIFKLVGFNGESNDLYSQNIYTKELADTLICHLPERDIFEEEKKIAKEFIANGYKFKDKSSTEDLTPSM